jgi:chromosome partitioning protein
MGKTVCIVNQKGGVGKTTTAVNLAAALALQGKRVLLVDFDPQGNASSGLGIDSDDRTENIYHVVIGERSIGSILRETTVKKLKCAPSNRDLIGAEVELIDMADRTSRLKQSLDPVKDEFDFILIDCPPSLGQLTINALVAADEVLVPVQSEYYAMEGLSELVGTIETIRETLNPELSISGIVVTMFDKRNNLSHQVETEIRRYFPDQTFKTRIPRNVRLSEAPSFGQPIFQYDIRSTGAEAYLALGREFLRRDKAAKNTDTLVEQPLPAAEEKLG